MGEPSPLAQAEDAVAKLRRWVRILTVIVVLIVAAAIAGGGFAGYLLVEEARADRQEARFEETLRQLICAAPAPPTANEHQRRHRDRLCTMDPLADLED